MSINPLNELSRVYLENIAESSHKKLDQVGQEDADIDNDGDTDKSDKYLHKRRKAIGKAMAKEAKEVKRWWDDDGDGKGYEEGEVSGKFKKKKVKEAKVYDPMEDPDFDPHEAEKKRGVSGKNNPKGGKPVKMKEGFSNWREELELFEITDKAEEKRITEKKVNNKIKINPKLGEAVEEMGGTLLEMVEIDEFDFILESAYDELIEEGYDEDEVEEALEYALTEAKVTFGHDTTSSGPEKKKSGLLAAARQKLAGAKASAKAAVSRGARKVAKGALGVARKMEGGEKKTHTAERKPSTYRGAGVGQKEKVSSGSYKAPEKKKAEPVSDPWEGSYKKSSEVKAKKTKAPAKPKAKAPAAKAPARKKKPNKLDSLLSSIRNEEKQLDEKALSRAQQRFMGMVYAAKKGETPASPEVAKAAAGMTKKAARDFAKTKHAKLPEKKVEEQVKGEVDLTQKRAATKPQPQPQSQNASAVSQVLLAKQKVDAAQKDLAMKQRTASQKKVDLQSLSASYQPDGDLVDEAKQSFPFKKVAAQKEKARKGSVYGKPLKNDSVPNTTDSEKKETTRFSKMHHAYEKAKREKQESDKERRSSTFYKDTHPASAPKMKKANEEFEVLDERRKEDKVAGTPRKPRNPAFELVAKSMGTGRMGVKPRGEKKVPGKKPPAAGEYGGPKSPAQKVAARRSSAQRAQDMMHSRFD